MKLTKTQKNALGDVARQVLVAEKANKAKAKALQGVQGLIADNEEAFRRGVEVSFEEDGRRYTCNLVMVPCPRWQAKDVTIEKLEANDAEGDEG